MRDLAENQDTVRNIRLWDYRPLLRTFSQIQQIRLYYQFYEVDVDRYPPGRRLPPDHAGGARADAGASRTCQDLGEPPSAVYPWLRFRDEPCGAGGRGGHADARGEGPAAGGDPRRAGRQSGDLLRRAHAGLRHRTERHPRAGLSLRGRQRLRELPRRWRGAARLALVAAALRRAPHGLQYPADRLLHRGQPHPHPAVVAGPGASHRPVPAARPRPIHGDDAGGALLDSGRLHHLRPVSLFRDVQPRRGRSVRGAIQLHPQQREGGDGRLRRLGRPLRHGP